MMPGNGPSLLFITLMSHKYAYQAIMKYGRDVAVSQDAAFVFLRLFCRQLFAMISRMISIAVVVCAAVIRCNSFCVN